MGRKSHTKESVEAMEEGAYVVEKILEKRIRNGKVRNFTNFN